MLHVIDTLHCGRPRVIATAVIETTDGLVMIDCGPEPVFGNVVAALHAMGREARDVRHLLLTHIHLDHGGGAWRWARETGATVYVHPRGARHLTEPSRLIASAERIYGARMAELWGDIEPIPAGRVRVVEDGERLRLGNIEMEALATPGHAQHHHAYRWEGTMFTGDVAGVRIGNGPPVPPCPPPDIDIEAWRASIDRIRRLRPEMLFLTHFGPSSDVAAVLDQIEARLVCWARWMKEQLRAGLDGAPLARAFEEFSARELREGGASDIDAADYERADPAFMSVSGLARYWREHHPEALV